MSKNPALIETTQNGGVNWEKDLGVTLDHPFSTRVLLNCRVPPEVHRYYNLSLIIILPCRAASSFPPEVAQNSLS